MTLSQNVQTHIRAGASALFDATVAQRRDFHQHPETAFEEVRTAGIIAARLEALGLNVRRGVGRTGVVAVSVSPVAVADVRLAAARDSLFEGTTLQLTLEARDAAGAPLTNRPAIWTSDRPAVAAVSAAGDVTALAPGVAATVAVPVRNTGETPDTFTVALEGLPAGWSASPLTVTLFEGEARVLQVPVTPPAGASGVVSTVNQS